MSDVRTVPYDDYKQALDELQGQFTCDYPRRVELFEMPRWGADDPIRIGVNWSAVGTVSTEEARDFLQLLEEAIELAEDFPYNGYVIDWGSE